MANIYVRDETESLPVGVLDLPGEPAVIINGVPPMPPATDLRFSFTISMENELPKSKGPGIWLEGREVRKQFGDQFYKGEVIKFNRETGWYRVLYEDGDFEDLEWHELEQVILLLDISVPLKTLALKIAKRREKPARGRGTGIKRGGRGKQTGGH